MSSLIKRFFLRLLALEPSPERRARSIALGIAIAFSPLLGIQTPVLFLLAFLLHLNSGVVFAVVYAVNNPWTMIPIIALDYAVGSFIMETILGIDLRPYDPAWADWVTTKLAYYLCVNKLCFWYYCIGGVLISIVLGVLTYIIIELIQQINAAQSEDNHTK